jgi:hypothetical protein
LAADFSLKAWINRHLWGQFVEMPAEKMRCANMHLLAMNKLDTKLPAAPIDPDTLVSRVENEGKSEGAVQG